MRYRAGTHTVEVERRFGLSRVIKLASNENPLGPSPLAVEAIRAALDHHRYPQEQSVVLRDALAEHLGVESGTILVGNGATGLIDVLMGALDAARDEVLLFEQTFVYYRASAQRHGLKYEEVPRGPGFAYDIDALIARIGPRTALVMLAAPDNPTGVHPSEADVRRILAALPPTALLVVDEAYREYVPDTLAFDALSIRDPRRIVLRTFSKCHGLAGLRCGYLVGDSSRVADLARRQPPFSVSTVAQHAAGAALRDDAHRGRSVRLNAAERERVGEALTRRGVGFVAGHGNFLMVNTWPLPALDTYERLLRRGIIVRPLDDYRLASHIRVTIGLPEENTSFVEHLAHVLES